MCARFILSFNTMEKCAGKMDIVKRFCRTNLSILAFDSDFPWTSVPRDSCQQDALDSPLGPTGKRPRRDVFPGSPQRRKRENEYLQSGRVSEIGNDAAEKTGVGYAHKSGNIFPSK